MVQKNFQRVFFLFCSPFSRHTDSFCGLLLKFCTHEFMGHPNFWTRFFAEGKCLWLAHSGWLESETSSSSLDWRPQRTKITVLDLDWLLWFIVLAGGTLWYDIWSDHRSQPELLSGLWWDRKSVGFWRVFLGSSHRIQLVAVVSSSIGSLFYPFHRTKRTCLIGNIRVYWRWDLEELLSLTILEV